MLFSTKAAIEAILNGQESRNLHRAHPPRPAVGFGSMLRAHTVGRITHVSSTRLEGRYIGMKFRVAFQNIQMLQAPPGNENARDKIKKLNPTLPGSPSSRSRVPPPESAKKDQAEVPP
jgi:hypothetical protein